MGCGYAVVASSLNAAKEIITDGVAGVLVEHANLTVLANAIIALLQDKAKRERLASNGRESVFKKLIGTRLLKTMLKY